MIVKSSDNPYSPPTAARTPGLFAGQIVIAPDFDEIPPVMVSAVTSDAEIAKHGIATLDAAA